MSTKVTLKRSAVQGKAPSSSDLDYGELAVNYTDGRIYYKDSSNNIQYFDKDIIIETSDTPPSSPSDGLLWWDSSDGNLYVYYQDVDSGQWVSATSTVIGPEGPEGPEGPAGAGIPVGGSSGEVLIKNSTTDYDTGWSSNYATTGKSIAMTIVFG